MSEGFLLTPDAEGDLTEIGDRITEESGLERSEAVVERIREGFRLLAEQPGIGHTREDLTDRPMLRFWRVFSYLIVYSRGTPSLAPITILRVVHGARGPGALGTSFQPPHI